jgi:hypothetical protein
MRKSLTQCLLALVCLAAAAGCKGGDGGTRGAGAGADPHDPAAVAAAADAFTDELLGMIDAATDPAAGLDEAQKLLDARAPELKAHIEAARAGEKFRESAEARAALLDSEVTNRDRVASLRKLHLERWMRDAAFKSKLDRLVADYDALWPRAG